MSQRPAPSMDFKALSKEDKIAYIEKSGAPDSERQRAIAEVKAGRL